MNEQLPRARCTLKKLHVLITTTREWNFENRTNERKTTTRQVHFEESDIMYGSLPHASESLKSEPMNEQLTRARCTLK